MRRRDDNALEVWVFGEGDSIPVGWLTTFRGDQVGEHVLVTSRSGKSAQHFKVDHRHLRYNHHEAAELGSFALKEKFEREVPGYATETKSPVDETYRYCWPILTLKQRDYEWIFDLPWFEPFDDGEPDFEQVGTKRLEDKMSSSISDMLTSAILHGDGTSRKGSLLEGGLSGTTATSALLDETSTITAEKIEAMMKLIPRKKAEEAFISGRRMGKTAMMEEYMKYRPEHDLVRPISYSTWATTVYPSYILPKISET